MHNRFEALQKRCKSRRRKTLLKWFVAALLLVAVAAGGYRYWQKENSLGTTGTMAVAMSPIVSETRRSEVEKSATVSIPHPTIHSIEKSHRVVQKSLPIEKRYETSQVRMVQRVEKSAPSEHGKSPWSKREASSKKAKKAHEGKKVSKSVKRPRDREVKKISKLKASVRKREKIATKKPIVQVKEVQDIDALIRQYEKFPKYATALKIARLYYEKKDYENSALWARKANLNDRDDEEAWVLYAKSEYALGNKDRARRILRLYLDYRESVKARTLLLSWRRHEDTKEKKNDDSTKNPSR